MFLADEVQGGLRPEWPAVVAIRRWPGSAPDLVTLGKPMGAGYPIGAVITRREIAEPARNVRVLLDVRGTPGGGRSRSGRARRAGDRPDPGIRRADR